MELLEQESTNLQEYTVSEISSLIKKIIDTNFSYVKIKGEISGIKYSSSGHVYFNLKDESAVIAAACWKNRMASMRIKPEDGMEVICYGSVTSYAGQSRYQINVEKIEIAGIGALMAMLEERKKKLDREGLFDLQHKKPIPQFPQAIAVITSAQGAVIKDILHRISERYPLDILLFPVVVQGENCAEQVMRAIINANNYQGAKIDTIIIARGGGSFEDLFPFNDEALARVAFSSNIPIISAIGHETDFCILDYVADLRAPTPTAAAELATPHKVDLLQHINSTYKQAFQINYKHLANLHSKLTLLSSSIISPENFITNKLSLLANYNLRSKAIINEKFSNNIIKIKNLEAKISVKALSNKISFFEEKLRNLNNKLGSAIKASIIRLNNFINLYEKSLLAANYNKILDRGFTVVKDNNDNVITSTLQLAVNQDYNIEFKDGIGKFKLLSLTTINSDSK